MKKKISILLAVLMLTIFTFLPISGLAKTSDNLSQQEIESILENEGILSTTNRVTTLEELEIIDNYFEENANAKVENIEEVLKKLDLEDVEVIPAEEIEPLINATSIQPFLPNAGMVMFRNVSHSDTLFYATLYARNIGVDSIDQIGGNLYGYAILPNTNYYTPVVKQFFNETSIKPFIDRKIGDYNIPHYKNKASFMAEYVVRDGSKTVTPTPAGVTFLGIK
ncbi:hypothetical protein MHB42_05690 [Lysinibacillus sp. FSL K6-0232]|uniref:hypothetical protein n=1 Tax=unclassified Lysinibacillus TaxID=2636778 RepID=UPI0030F9A28C